MNTGAKERESAVDGYRRWGMTQLERSAFHAGWDAASVVTPEMVERATLAAAGNWSKAWDDLSDDLKDAMRRHTTIVLTAALNGESK